MQTSDSNNYISLQEATKYCNYSQEYLSLRARQGKLKAIKFGRNWVTKKKWLEEYLKKITSISGPPKNLPVKTSGGIILAEVKKRSGPKLRFGFVLSLVFVLIFGAVFLGRNSLCNVYENILPYQKISQTGSFAVEKLSQFFLTLADKMFDIFSKRSKIYY